MRLRLELPAPTDERRTQLARQAKEAAETARVAVRLARRDAINELRRSRAADEISEGKLNGRSKDLQVWTDERVAQVDELLATALAAIAE
jgi:ribosome recycling factor